MVAVAVVESRVALLSRVPYKYSICRDSQSYLVPLDVTPLVSWSDVTSPLGTRITLLHASGPKHEQSLSC